MAKAALDAINGVNLFGEDGSQLSTIHVDPDAQYRNYMSFLTHCSPKSICKLMQYTVHSGYHSFPLIETLWAAMSEE